MGDMLVKLLDWFEVTVEKREGIWVYLSLVKSLPFPINGIVGFIEFNLTPSKLLLLQSIKSLQNSRGERYEWLNEEIEEEFNEGFGKPNCVVAVVGWKWLLLGGLKVCCCCCWLEEEIEGGWIKSWLETKLL